LADAKRENFGKPNFTAALGEQQGQDAAALRLS
jgi:hypothetical protein